MRAFGSCPLGTRLHRGGKSLETEGAPDEMTGLKVIPSGVELFSSFGFALFGKIFSGFNIKVGCIDIA
jgi:hypothetical protein